MIKQLFTYVQIHFVIFDRLVYNQEAILQKMHFGIPDGIPIKDKNEVTNDLQMPIARMLT